MDAIDELAAFAAAVVAFVIGVAFGYFLRTPEAK